MRVRREEEPFERQFLRKSLVGSRRGGVARKEGQDTIYYLAGASKEAVARSPLLEAFTDKGYEVLLFSDPVDELWLGRAPGYKEKRLKSIACGEVQLGSEDERKQAQDALKAKEDDYHDLLGCRSTSRKCVSRGA